MEFLYMIYNNNNNNNRIPEMSNYLFSLARKKEIKMNNIFFCKRNQNGYIFSAKEIKMNNIFFCKRNQNGYIFSAKEIKMDNIFSAKEIKMIKCKKSFSNEKSRESRENDFR